MAVLTNATQNFSKVLRAPGFLHKQYRSQGASVINKTGSSIAANKVVAISGYDVTTKHLKIVLADADSANLATELYVTQSAIADGAKGRVWKGFLSPATLDTSGASTVGDALYLSATAGAFTSTAPTGTNARVVIVGYSTVKSSTVGQIHWDVQLPQKLGSSDLTGASNPIEVVIATNVILAAESGTTYFLNAATEFVSTLPAPAAGLNFSFIVTGAPSGASYTVIGASGTPIHGQVLSKDLNGATDSATTAGTGVLTLTFVDGKSIKGDRADFISDGTDWFVRATTGGNFDAITLS